MFVQVSDPGGRIDWQRAADDAQVAVQWVRTKVFSSGKVAALGFCMGGRTAFLAVAGGGVDASISLYALGVAIFSIHAQIAALGTKAAVPGIYPSREYAEAGGLASYGADVRDEYRKAGVYAGRLLQGAKPADLPILQPTKFELVINLKTARSIGLNISDSFQLLAGEVIE